MARIVAAGEPIYYDAEALPRRLRRPHSCRRGKWQEDALSHSCSGGAPGLGRRR